MTDLYVFAAVVVAMALTLLVALWRAPEGWEDQAGFHYRSGVSYNHDNAPDRWHRPR